MKITDLYLRGKNQYMIASILGLNRNTVRYDLDAIKEAWQKSALMNFHEAKAIELAKLDKMEMELWDQWERSKKVCKKETETREPTGKKHVQTLTEKTVQKTEQCGDPRYIVAMIQIGQRRARLLGLDVEEIPLGDGVIAPVQSGKIGLPAFSAPRPREMSPTAQN